MSAIKPDLNPRERGLDLVRVLISLAVGKGSEAIAAQYAWPASNVR